MIQTGLVVQAEPGKARVRVEARSSCEGCVCETDGGSCTADPSLLLWAEDPLGVRRGMRVELWFKPWRMILTVILVFWLPLMLGGLGYWSGSSLFAAADGTPHVGGGVVGCFIGLGLALFLIRLAEIRARERSTGVVVKKILNSGPLSEFPPTA